MATFETIKAKLTALLSGANQTTGNPDTTLTDAVNRLREGFGKGAVTRGLTVTENGSYYPPVGVDGFDSVDVSVDVAALPLEVSENGTYYPGSYACDYFDSVTVNVGFADMQNPAGEDEVRIGKQYIGSDGLVHSGSMPEKSADSVTINTGNSKNFSVSFPAGYYPEAVTVSGQTGYTGGNANMNFANSMLAVGSVLFPEQVNSSLLPACLYLWKQTTESAFGAGSGMYYMPSSIILMLDSPLIINGAFYAESINMSGSATNQTIFSGSDLTGAYRLNLAITSGVDMKGDRITGMNLTNNGEPVDISSGIAASVYLATAYI